MPELPGREVLDALRRYDTPTLANAIETFDVRPRDEGFASMDVKCLFPDLGVMVGYAATATIRARGRGQGDGDHSPLWSLVRSLPAPRVVVVQDLDDPPVAATFGEIMCSTYQAFGAAGLITSGAARDLDQVRRIGFPAFSNGAICSHGYSHIVAVHTPVRVGGVAVHPGDLLHADANGVTTIPHSIASEVAQVAAEYVAAEAVILDFTKTGSNDVKKFTAARLECFHLLGELGKRVCARRASA